MRLGLIACLCIILSGSFSPVEAQQDAADSPTSFALKNNSDKVTPEAQALRRRDVAEYKPDFPPSYVLHVVPSQTEGRNNFSSDDFWSLQGFNVESAIGTAYDLNSIRIKLPPSLDKSKLYDFSMFLPEPESTEQMKQRFQRGIQDYFQLTAMHEMRFMDVYVVTTANSGKLAPSSSNPEGGGFFGWGIALQSSKDAVNEPICTTLGRAHTLSEISGISGGGRGTIDDFCHMLEGFLDHPVVNEPKLAGEFIFKLQANGDFLNQLREQFGLVIAPAQRNVDILVFNPR